MVSTRSIYLQFVYFDEIKWKLIWCQNLAKHIANITQIAFSGAEDFVKKYESEEKDAENVIESDEKGEEENVIEEKEDNSDDEKDANNRDESTDEGIAASDDDKESLEDEDLKKNTCTENEDNVEKIVTEIDHWRFTNIQK